MSTFAEGGLVRRRSYHQIEDVPPVELTPAQQSAREIARVRTEEFFAAVLRQAAPYPPPHKEEPIFVRNELLYRPVHEDGDRVFRYRPRHDVIEVDGVTYTMPSGHTGQVMLTLKNDELPCDAARMRCDRPPTEGELDEWVRNGTSAYI